jgi:hypothetical protein
MLIFSGHGEYRNVAKTGKFIGGNEDEEVFRQKEAFGDVMVSVTGGLQGFGWRHYNGQLASSSLTRRPDIRGQVVVGGPAACGA